MKKQIRQGVFETNSSSTHSICIAKDIELTLPKSIHFEFGDFGWECDQLVSVSEKASYLYTGLIANEQHENVTKMIEMLKSEGIEVTVETPVYNDESYTNSKGELVEYKYGKNVGYVDHADDLSDFLSDVMTDKNKLLNYLFSDLSFILTGNDNDETDVEIKVDYPHDEYYKGN